MGYSVAPTAAVAAAPVSPAAFRRDTETQAEAPAYSAKAAGSRVGARTETVLVATPSLVIASLVGRKGRGNLLVAWYRCARMSASGTKQTCSMR
jgi:hypothetical protein